MDVLDEEVLATLQDDVFRPAVIEEAIRLALEALSPAQAREIAGKLEAERRAARADCERLGHGDRAGRTAADAARASPERAGAARPRGGAIGRGRRATRT